MPTRVGGSTYVPPSTSSSPTSTSRPSGSQPVQSTGYAQTSSFSGGPPPLNLLDDKTKELIDGLDDEMKDLFLKSFEDLSDTRFGAVNIGSKDNPKMNEGPWRKTQAYRGDDVPYDTYKRMAGKAADILKGLLSPEAAKKILSDGFFDDKGRKMGGPPTNPELKRLLEKVAGGQKLTPEELKKGVNKAKDDLRVDNMMESSMWQMLDNMLKQAYDRAKEAMKYEGSG